MADDLVVERVAYIEAHLGELEIRDVEWLLAQLAASEAERGRLAAALEYVRQAMVRVCDMMHKQPYQANLVLQALIEKAHEVLAAPAKESREAPQPRYTSLDDGRRTPFEPYAEPKILEVKATTRPLHLSITWANGTTSDVDLTGLVQELEVFIPLEDPVYFRQVTVGEWGWSVQWADHDVSIGSDTLWRLRAEKEEE